MRVKVFALMVGLIAVLCMSCAPTAASGTSASVNPDLMAAGEQIYSNGCFRCHGADGLGGDRGPAHAGNARLAYAPYTIDRMLYGYGYKGMPAFAKRLSDEQIAAVTTYIRNSWGNNFGDIKPEWVAAARARR